MGQATAFGVGFLGVGFFLLLGGVATMNGGLPTTLATAGVLALAGVVVAFTILLLRKGTSQT